MLILTIRTDNPEAEIGLFNDDQEIDYLKWHAHRELSDTIHQKISNILDFNSKSINDLEGILIYQGPGSFTGLRIGFSVANALAYSLNCKISTSREDDWITVGIFKLLNDQLDKQVFPFYGADVHITKAKK
jgi:tRNA threonylcarbamoyl adenosine modification protein YeaZ